MYLREYETVFILRPDVTEEETTRLTDRLDDAMAKSEGIVLRRDVWGKRKLAYEIDKHQKGVYHYHRYLGNSDLVAELERNLQLVEHVLKYMTVLLSDRVDPEERKAQVDQELAEEERQRVEMEERQAQEAAEREARREQRESEAKKEETPEDAKEEKDDVEESADGDSNDESDKAAAGADDTEKDEEEKQD